MIGNNNIFNFIYFYLLQTRHYLQILFWNHAYKNDHNFIFPVFNFDILLNCKLFSCYEFPIFNLKIPQRYKLKWNTNVILNRYIYFEM